VPRAVLLSAIVLGLLMTTGCWPVAQSQPSASTPAAAPVATTAPAAKAPSSPAAGQKPTASPVAAAPKPTASPVTTTPAAAKPTSKPAAAASTAAASPPAVVATSVAGLPAIGASPVSGGEPRATAPPDALGVAASAGSAAAAATTDSEAVALCGPGAVLSTRAAQQAGRQATVAIAKVDGSYQASVRGQPTFLNDAPFPNHTFTVVIWGRDRRQFQPPPEGAWQGKALCVTGPVEIFQQRPQIVVSSPSQLRAAQ
jgi:hypothetical protein